MKRVIQIVLVSLMFVVPILGFLTTDPSYIIKSENRTLAKFPKFGTKDFFSDLVQWYTDRLYGKIKISEKFFTHFYSVYADESFSPNRLTVLGESNWFFLGDAANFVYSQHTKELKIPISNINRKITFLKNIKNQSSAQFYLVVGPDKHGIYPEFLRSYIYEPAKHRAFDKYKHILTENGIEYIDNFECLNNAKKSLKDKHTLYYSNDSHWNCYGAYIAFNNVMSHIVDSYEPISYSFTFSSKETGDLTRNIVPPKHGYLDNVVVHNNESISIQEYVTDGSSYLKKFFNKNSKDDRKVMIMADSFGGSFAPYAIDYFRNVILLPRVEIDGILFEQVIKQEKPDLILYVNVERNVFFD